MEATGSETAGSGVQKDVLIYCKAIKLVLVGLYQTTFCIYTTGAYEILFILPRCLQC